MAASQKQLAGIDRMKNNLQSNLEDERHKREKLAATGSSPLIFKRRPVAAASILRPKSKLDESINAGRSKPASPAMHALATKPANTLAPAPTSAPASSRNESALAAAKRPVIHLLAIRPITALALSQKIGLPEPDIISLLSKFGKQSREPDQWELADRSYRELDIWSFRYPSTQDRSAAQDNARRAFDRTRIPVSDTKMWDKLNAPADRNKGVCLSKLKMDNGAKGLGISGTTSQAPSDHRKLLAGAGIDPNPRPKSSQSNLMRVMNGQKPLKRPVTPQMNASSTRSPAIGTKSPATEKASSEKGKARPVAKETPKQKSNAKQFKSDEYIIDEDEDDADLAGSAFSQSTSSPEKANKGKSESASKKRKATADTLDHVQHSTLGKSTMNDAKRLKTSNEGKQIKPSQSTGMQKVEKSQSSVSSTRSTVESTIRHSSHEVKKPIDKAAHPKPSERRDTGSKAVAMDKNGVPNAGQKATTRPESTSKPKAKHPEVQAPASKQTTSKPVSKHQSNPSSSHSDASRGSTATMEEYRILQTKYLNAFRKNLHLRLMIYTIPPDILTAADQARSDDAAAESEGLSDTIKTFLVECSERELNLLGMDPQDILKLTAQDKAFHEGADVDPWILLPDHHSQIVDEVVGWREYTKVKMVALLKDYNERRNAFDDMVKGSREEKAMKAWLHERALAIKCLQAINSR